MTETMEVIGIVLLCLFFLFLRPLVEEFWTILQIFKSFFVTKKNLPKIYGPWAIVTGCTDGIGKSFAFELAKRGLNIVLVSRNPSKLQQVAGEIESQHNVETKIIVADFSKGQEIFPKIQEELEGMDIGILINNVGVQYTYPMYFGELPEHELWGLININIGGLLHMTRIVLPKMAARKRGAVINISSGSKLQPLPFMNLYAASKIFVDYFTEALRHEYRKKNVTIQCLCPYYISTKINHFSDDLMKVNMFIPDTEKYVRKAITSLGVIDNTTGYWPHRLQYLLLFLCPTWVKTYVGGLIYRSLRYEYLKDHPKVTVET